MFREFEDDESYWFIGQHLYCGEPTAGEWNLSGVEMKR